MSIGCSSLQLNGNGCKQQNLNGGTTGIPEGTRNTISVCNTRTLQQSCSPGPGRDDSRCDKTRFHGSSSRAEHFGGLEFMVVSFEDPCNENLLPLAHASSMNNKYIERKKLTIPNANTAPKPRTIPYPHPTDNGGAIAILVDLQKLFADSMKVGASRSATCDLGEYGTGSEL